MGFSLCERDRFSIRRNRPHFRSRDRKWGDLHADLRVLSASLRDCSGA